MRNPGIALILLLPALAACGAKPVKPWQREALQRPEMAVEPDPLLATYRRHTEFSKEASSGDAAMAGVGCGCN
jgi:hypothetical protein